MTATSEIGRSAEILIGDRPIAAVGIGVQGRELGFGKPVSKIFKIASIWALTASAIIVPVALLLTASPL